MAIGLGRKVLQMALRDVKSKNFRRVSGFATRHAGHPLHLLTDDERLRIGAKGIVIECRRCEPRYSTQKRDNRLEMKS